MAFVQVEGHLALPVFQGEKDAVIVALFKRGDEGRVGRHREAVLALPFAEQGRVLLVEVEAAVFLGEDDGAGDGVHSTAARAAAKALLDRGIAVEHCELFFGAFALVRDGGEVVLIVLADRFDDIRVVGDAHREEREDEEDIGGDAEAVGDKDVRRDEPGDENDG